MKIAVGMKRPAQIFNTEYLRFLRQIGVTHVYGYKYDTDVLPSAKNGYWSYEDLVGLKKHFADNGLVLEGIENFVPLHWHKILRDEPGREEQLENVKRSIRNMGRAGINIMGYHFSLTGCPERYDEEVGRGGVNSTVYDAAKYPEKYEYYPKRMTWGAVVEPDAEGYFPAISREEIRDRKYRFLEEILPVAEEAGVQMAEHPEDPPVPYIYNIGRVLVTPEDYDHMIARFPSPSNMIEFCQGTFTEMGCDIYETIRKYASAGRISYVHLRNVHGTVPHYEERVIDDGDVNMAEALRAYRDSGYTGAFIPDHYPELIGADIHYAGVAHTIGYIRGLMKGLDIPIWGEDYKD